MLELEIFEIRKVIEQLKAASSLKDVLADEQLIRQGSRITSSIKFLHEVELKYGPMKLWKCLAGMQHCFYPQGQIIFKQGEEFSFFYILLNGSVKIVRTKDQSQFFVQPIQCFGDIGLLKQSKRNSRAIANADCNVLRMKRADYQQYSKKSIQQQLLIEHRFFQDYLGTVEKFNQFIKLPIVKLNIKKGRPVFRDGQPIRGYYVIYTGQVVIYKLNAKRITIQIKKLGVGRVLHDVNLFSNPNSKHSYSATCNDDCILFFVDVLGNQQDNRSLLQRLSPSLVSRLSANQMTQQLIKLFHEKESNKFDKELTKQLRIMPLVLDPVRISNKKNTRSQNVQVVEVDDQTFRLFVNQPMMEYERMQKKKHLFDKKKLSTNTKQIARSKGTFLADVPKQIIKRKLLSLGLIVQTNNLSQRSHTYAWLAQSYKRKKLNNCDKKQDLKTSWAFSTPSLSQPLVHTDLTQTRRILRKTRHNLFRQI